MLNQRVQKSSLYAKKKKKKKKNGQLNSLKSIKQLCLTNFCRSRSSLPH